MGRVGGGPSTHSGWAFFSLAPCFLSLIGFLYFCPLCPASVASPGPCLCPGGRGRQTWREGPWHQISFLLSGQQSPKCPRAGLGWDPVQPRCSPFCVGPLHTVQWLLLSHCRPGEEFHPINSYTSPWQHGLPTLPKKGDRSTKTRGS